MNYGIIDFLTLIGALGIFLYGMKLMSEALQKVAGQRLRGILATMTKNKFVGILTGLLVTAIIQSSSATTVMVVSFVNAGLLNLTQAFSVIMGANIGTTVTAWLISIFGFKVDISAFAVPIIAFTLPLLFSKNNTRRYIGEMILGFALLFMGIGLLNTSVPDIQNNPGILEFLQHFTGWGYGSILLFMLVGTLLTVIVQSSSAMMAITLVMCAQGWIPFELAVAMVLGQNIGTTITANLAALPASWAAKQAAFSHFVFNMVGVILALIFFYPLMKVIYWIVPEISPEMVAIHGTPVEASTFALSIFHTMFNVCNTLILVWFSKYIIMLVEKIIRPHHQQQTTTDEDDSFKVAYISTGLLSTSELSILQAEKEVQLYAERIKHMYTFVPDILQEKDPEAFAKKYERLKNWEDRSDKIEVEIAKYVYSVTNGRLSPEGKHQTQLVLRVISELESMADACYKIACIAKNNQERMIELSKEDWPQVDKMIALVSQALDNMTADLSLETLSAEAIEQVKNLELQINELRNEVMKDTDLELTREGEFNYEQNVYFHDVIRMLERLGDYIVNVIEAKANRKIFKEL